MRPAIQPGERLTVDPAARPRVGDVVAVIGGDGALVAHRLVRVERGRLWTRGDMTPWPDPPHRPEQLVGVVARGGAAGAAAARWPTLAPLVGALMRVRGADDLPGAAGALAAAVAIRLVRARR